MQADTFAVLLNGCHSCSSGFLFNLLVGVLAMALGTAAGLPLGLTQLAAYRPVRASGWLLIQVLRNVPWLVLLFYVMFLLPFEVRVLGLTFPVPAWAKAVVGLALRSRPTSRKSFAAGSCPFPWSSGRARRASPSRVDRCCSWSYSRRHSGACCRPG